MPLIELKTIKPVCDSCGKVGSTWTNIQVGEEEKAVPDGWTVYIPPYWNPHFRPPNELLCDDCEPPDGEGERDEGDTEEPSVSEDELLEDVLYVRPRRWSNLTGMTTVEVYRHIYAGRLSAKKIGRQWYIPASEIHDFFSRMDGSPENDSRA